MSRHEEAMRDETPKISVAIFFSTKYRLARVPYFIEQAGARPLPSTETRRAESSPKSRNSATAQTHAHYYNSSWYIKVLLVLQQDETFYG